MPDRSEAELIEAMRTGDRSAFERLYDRYHQRVRLMAWRISHRPDWVDDILNEAWCRAFRQRKTYNSTAPFPVWLAGILQNVYREHCRSSPVTLDAPDQAEGAAGVEQRVENQTPERIAAEAEVLQGLNDCVSRLGPGDAELVRLRFFHGLPLRLVAEQLNVPESTIRDVRLPAAYRALRTCLERKGLDSSQFFPAQEKGENQ